jgi:cytochrome P450
MSMALFLLATNVEQRERLLSDRSLLPNAVEEVLRYEAPMQNYARVLTRDVEIRGQRIPSGERLVLVSAAANRDERRYEDPDRFEMSREPKRHLTFGEGIHFCLGAALARLEARILLDEVLTAIPRYELAARVVRTTKQNSRGFRHLDLTC